MKERVVGGVCLKEGGGGWVCPAGGGGLSGPCVSLFPSAYGLLSQREGTHATSRDMCLANGVVEWRAEVW